MTTPRDRTGSLDKTGKPAAPPEKQTADTPSDPDEHIGATENQISDTPPPAGEAYDDEPKQG